MLFDFGGEDRRRGVAEPGVRPLGVVVVDNAATVARTWARLVNNSPLAPLPLPLLDKGCNLLGAPVEHVGAHARRIGQPVLLRLTARDGLVLVASFDGGSST